jgi:hypothetical protein
LHVRSENSNQLLVEAHVKNNTKGVPNIAFRKRDVFT